MGHDTGTRCDGHALDREALPQERFSRISTYVLAEIYLPLLWLCLPFLPCTNQRFREAAGQCLPRMGKDSAAGRQAESALQLGVFHPRPGCRQQSSLCKFATCARSCSPSSRVCTNGSHTWPQNLVTCSNKRSATGRAVGG